MKFYILSGAYLNAGDFLIVDRTIKLLKHFYPKCEINIIERKRKLDNYLDSINSSDALILAGGPAFIENVYPDVIPLVDNLDKITTKIVSIGLGWYGKDTANKYIYSYKYTEDSKKLFDRIIKDSKNLSCRDFYSVKSLLINGYKNIIMTGCPAWYNLDLINQIEPRKGININFKKICISDPANRNNFKQAIEVAKFLRYEYPKSEIFFVCHRIEKNNNKYDSIIKEMKQIGLKFVDISGSAEGFRIYDDCDIHIGYRVHAHIYNLSNRNLSILIEEDARGTGVNEALGLKSIKANSSMLNNTRPLFRIVNSLFSKLLCGRYMINKYIINDIKLYIATYIQPCSLIKYKSAYLNMKMNYEIMAEHIKNIIEK